MKMPELLKIEGAFEADTLRILRGIPGIVAALRSANGPEREPVATLRYAGIHNSVAVQVKRRANAATAWQLVHVAQTRPELPRLLIADETTVEARGILVSHGIGVIDAAGNAHLELPGLLFHHEGHRRHAGTIPSTRLRGKAGVVAQALLLDPDRAWRVQDLATEAQVSIGLAHRALTRLEHEELVKTEGIGPRRVRRVTNPTALLDLWTEETSDRITRTPAFLLAQTPEQLIETLGANLERNGIGYALTGAAAASRIAPFITAIPVVEVWVSATAAVEELLDGAQAEAVATGPNVLFLQGKDDSPLAFRQPIDGLWLANPFRIYADLRHDPRRGREQADHLRREVIGF
jgi:hypothetical protein